MKTIITLLALFLIQFLAKAQDPIELINSQTVVAKAHEHFQKKDYDLAIKEYKRVPQGDTNYFIAQYEITYALFMQERYEEAIQESRRLIYEGTDQMNQFNILGSSLDEVKRYDEAISVYNLALKRFPYSVNLNLNKGIVFERKGDLKGAWATYMELLNISPCFPSTHLRIAKMAESEGKYTQAIMAYTIFLMLEPASKRSLNVITDFNKLCDNSSSIINTSKQPILTNEFEDLDFLIQNQIALNEKYKVPGKMKFPLNKQLHLVFEKAANSVKEEGFFSQYYLPFFKNFLSSEDFVSFNLLLLASSDNEKIQKEVNAKINEVKKTRESTVSRFQKIHKTKELNWNGEKINLNIFYYAKYNPEAYGTISAANKTVGPFFYLSEEGYIDVIGNYDNNGNKDGKWYFFGDKGDTTRVLSYKAGRLEGSYRLFKNGFLSETGIYVNELIEGEVLTYYADGSKSKKINFKNGFREGKSIEYYPNGNIMSDYNYSKGLGNGLAKSYYAQGNLKEEFTFKNGKTIGNLKQYWENKNLKKDCNFKEDILDGPYKTFFMNGSIEQEGIATNGKTSGKWLEYYSNGKLKEQSNLDENGKVNGDEITFDYNGKQFRYDTYVKGEWKYVKFFDKNGKPFYETKIIRSGTKVTLYNQYREKTATGEIKDDKRNGEWRFYYPNGKLNSIEIYEKGKMNGITYTYLDDNLPSSKANYTDGAYNGLYISYYQNGKIKSQGNYINGSKYGLWKNYQANGVLDDEYFYFDSELKDWGYEYLSNGKIYKKYKYVKDILREVHHCDTNGLSIDSASIPTGTARISLKGMGGYKIYEGGFLNGKVHGPATWFFPNGKIREKGEYFEGDANGEWNIYHPNGKLKKKHLKFYGYSTGTNEEYNYFGEPIGKFDYKDGKNHGKNVWFYLDGKIESEISYFNGDKNGPSKYFAQTGELREIRYYSYGRLIGYSYLDKTNNLKDTLFTPTGDGVIHAFYANGNPSTSFEIFNGQYHNEYKIFYPNGALQEERFYQYGNETKPTKIYYPNGKLMRVEPYLIGFLHGTVMEYYLNGNIKSIENYVNGYKEGISEYFDANNKKIGAYHYMHGEILKFIP